MGLRLDLIAPIKTMTGWKASYRYSIKSVKWIVSVRDQRNKLVSSTSGSLADVAKLLNSYREQGCTCEAVKLSLKVDGTQWRGGSHTGKTQGTKAGAMPDDSSDDQEYAPMLEASYIPSKYK